MQNHLIIISMIIILENFNIDIIRSRDLILFSLFQLKSEKYVICWKWPLVSFYNYLFIIKGEVFPVVGKEIIQNNCPSKIKTFQVKPYCIKFLHTMNILYLSKVIT